MQKMKDNSFPCSLKKEVINCIVCYFILICSSLVWRTMWFFVAESWFLWYKGDHLPIIQTLMLKVVTIYEILLVIPLLMLAVFIIGIRKASFWLLFYFRSASIIIAVVIVSISFVSVMALFFPTTCCTP